MKKLTKGSKIGIVSPSSAVAAMAPHRFNRAIETLRNMGYEVVIGKHALDKTAYTAGTAEDRAADLMEFFINDEIDAIICTIGGYHANQVLKHLDFEEIKKHPKIFCGFSDISVLHFALQAKCGFVTYYGPALLPQFGEYPEMNPYTVDWFLKALTEESLLEFAPSKEYTEEFLNWFTNEDETRARTYVENPGWNWLKPGVAEGRVLGGCLTSILHLRGTDYWPDLTNAIFFWETAPSKCSMTAGEPLSNIDAYLTDLELSGVFDQIQGMVVGRIFGYSAEQNEELKALIIDRLKDYNFPVLFGFDIGHTEPIVTLPVGSMGKMDSTASAFIVDQSS